MIRIRTSRWLLSASLLAFGPAAILAADKDGKDQKAGAPKVEGKGPGPRVEQAPPAAAQPRGAAPSQGKTPEVPATIGPRRDRRPDNPVPPANPPARQVRDNAPPAAPGVPPANVQNQIPAGQRDGQRPNLNRDAVNQLRNNTPPAATGNPPANVQNQPREGQRPNLNRDAIQQLRDNAPTAAPGTPPANVQNQIPGAARDGQRPNVNRDGISRQNPANNAQPSTDQPGNPAVYQPLRPNADPNSAAKNPPASNALQQIQDANRAARKNAADQRANDAAQRQPNDAAQPRANDAAQQRANDAAQRQAAQNRAAQNAADRNAPQGTVNQNVAPNTAQHDIARDARRENRAAQRTLNDILGTRNAAANAPVDSRTNVNTQVQVNQDRSSARIAADHAARTYFTGTPRQNRAIRAEARQTARQDYGAAIRRGFVGRSANVFSPRWWGTHRNAWGNQWSSYPSWSTRFGNGYNGQAYGFGSNWPWQAASWTTIASLQPNTWSQPIAYDYGGNVYYQDGMVYFDDQPTVSIVDYATSARRLATSGVVDAGNPEDWTPLGVFALADENGADPSMYFQLALNKNGALGGNFYNAYSDQTTPIQGSVDLQTQRAAWVISSNPDTVFETGLYNLTQPETSILAHMNNNEDQTLFMVRVDAPESVATPASATQP